MGNGPSNKPDSAKPALATRIVKQSGDIESDLASGGADLGSDNSEQEGSFCSRPQIAEFRVAVLIEPNAEVRLQIGRPPSVISSSGEIVGELTGQTAAALRNCLELGYVIGGVTEQRHIPGEIARVVVRGRR